MQIQTLVGELRSHMGRTIKAWCHNWDLTQPKINLYKHRVQVFFFLMPLFHTAVLTNPPPHSPHPKHTHFSSSWDKTYIYSPLLFWKCNIFTLVNSFPPLAFSFTPKLFRSLEKSIWKLQGNQYFLQHSNPPLFWGPEIPQSAFLCYFYRNQKGSIGESYLRI